MSVIAEVEHVLGRKMTKDETAIYLICRNYGMVNPIDLAREVTK